MSDKQPSFKESLNTSLEVIAEEPMLRAILNAIPSVGGSLNELMAGKGQRMIEERRDNLLRLLAEHMEAIEAEAIRQDYFQTPEGFDLLIQALDASRRTGSEEKRDLIARILAGAVSDNEGKYSPEEYLHLLSDLTAKDLMLARSIYKAKFGVDRNIFSWTDTACEELNLDRMDVFVMLTRLEARGLLQTVDVYRQDKVTTSKERTRTLPPTDKKGIERIDRILVTPAFTKLMRFLDLDT